jgi:Flp pilus assembly protein TadG
VAAARGVHRDTDPCGGSDVIDRPRVRRPGVARAAAGERGQATVEFALALGVIAVLVVAIARVGVVIRDELAVGLAAREGARAAAVSADPASAAVAAATRAVSLPIAVSTSAGSTTVTVSVVYTDGGGSSIISRIFGSVVHRSSATMALEPP